MHLRSVVSAALFLLVGSASASAGFVQMLAHNPVSGSFFDVLANLTDPLIPTDPCHLLLTDPTHPVLTNNVLNEAVFDFDIRGRNGEAFSYEQVFSDLDFADPQRLNLHFHAIGSLGSFFDVFFDASYQDGNGNHPPASGVQTSQPVDPCRILYTLAFDPPFSAGIFILDPTDGNLIPFTFVETPEPGTLAMLAGFGVTVLAGWRRRSPGGR